MHSNVIHSSSRLGGKTRISALFWTFVSSSRKFWTSTCFEKKVHQDLREWLSRTLSTTSYFESSMLTLIRILMVSPDCFKGPKYLNLLLFVILKSPLHDSIHRFRISSSSSSSYRRTQVILNVFFRFSLFSSSFSCIIVGLEIWPVQSVSEKRGLEFRWSL